jgi:hypothetical protein
MSHIAPQSRFKVKHPHAITMWDFSWLERRWPGAGYEDWDRALDGLVERGYDAVRIDAYPHLLAAAPTAPHTLKPCWTTELWGSPSPVTVQVWPALPDFIRACAARGIKVALSTWWREDEHRHAHRLCGAADLARVWAAALDLLAKENLLNALLYVDLSNEWPTSIWTPFYQPTAPATQEDWQAPGPLDIMREAIGNLRVRFPSLPFTFSTTSRPEAWGTVENCAFIDLIEHHLWLSSIEFYRRIDYRFEAFSEVGYDKLRARARALYESNPTHWRDELGRTLDQLVAGSHRLHLPLVNTEGWSLVTWRDGPGMEWDWLLGITEFAVERACASGRYAAVCTSNFCGPQFVGMWREIAWHRRLTAQIKAAPLAPDLA